MRVKEGSEVTKDTNSLFTSVIEASTWAVRVFVSAAATGFIAHQGVYEGTMDGVSGG